MTPKTKEAVRHAEGLTAAFRFVAAGITLALYMSCSVGCSAPANESKDNKQQSQQAPAKAADRAKPEPRSNESKSVDSTVQSEVQRMEAEKRATLLKDAQSALEETRNALAALDKGDKQGALSALERATGKLDLVVSRDPKLALAPVGVTTIVIDLYTNPDGVKSVVKQAKDDLSKDRLQQARLLIQDLASEADIHVTEIPLATYPAAIRAVAPLVDAGKIDEAKAALTAALHTLVVDTYIIPLPKIRAEAMLAAAETLANKSNRTEDEKTTLRNLIEATRHELQLGEALGYGTKDDYKALYAQLDDIQKKTEGNQSGVKGLFTKLRTSLKNFKFSS